MISMGITRLLTIAPIHTILAFILLTFSSMFGIISLISASMNSLDISMISLSYFLFITSIILLVYVNKVSSALNKAKLSWDELPSIVREEITSFANLAFIPLIFLLTLLLIVILLGGVRGFDIIPIVVVLSSIFLLLSAISLIGVKINPYELVLYTKFWHLFRNMRFRMYVFDENISIFIGHEIFCIIRRSEKYLEKVFEIYILKGVLFIDTPDDIFYGVNKYEILEDTRATTIKLGEVTLIMRRVYPVRKGVIWIPNRIIQGKALILEFKILSSESPRVFASRVMEVFQYALNKYYDLLTPVNVHYLSI